MYGKRLAVIKEGTETITLQENGAYYNFQSTVTGSHRLSKQNTSPERLQAHWEHYWFSMLEHTKVNGGLNGVPN